MQLKKFGSGFLMVKKQYAPLLKEGLDSGEDLMAILIQALSGTEGIKTIGLRGHLNGKEVFMLIDSGSSHNFINDQLVELISP